MYRHPDTVPKESCIFKYTNKRLGDAGRKLRKDLGAVVSDFFWKGVLVPIYYAFNQR